MKANTLLALLTALLVAACLMASEAMGQQPARDQASGPLRVHPTNPRYFTDGTKTPDGTMRAVYLTGSHTWNALYDARGPLDYPAYLNFLVQHNHNFTKFRAWDSTLLYKPMYYNRTGPGTASDGLLKVDLNQFDQAHFDRMRERLIAARDKGIYVMIMLFETEEPNSDPAFSNPLSTSWDHLDRSRWAFHPYNKLNNINGIDGGNRDNSAPAWTETLDHAGITKLREAYIRKVIDTVNDLDNVLFEIANETHNGDPNATNVSQYGNKKSPYGPLAPEDHKWQYHMTDYIHSYEKTKPKQHPVVMTASLFGPNDWLYASPAEGISPSANGGGRGYQENPPAADGKKVILADPDHFGCPLWLGTPSWAWKSFVRGLNPIPLESLPTSLAGNDGGGWGGGDMPVLIETRKAMGHTRNYATRMDLASMVPRNDLASTTFCLANHGQEYLVCQPGTGEFSVNLTAGTFSSEWFNPTTGSVASTGSINAAGGNQTFTPPFSGPAVLYLKVANAEAGAASGAGTARKEAPEARFVPRDARLDKAFGILSDAVDKGMIPGYIALVAEKGEIKREEAHGLADIEKKSPFCPDTICWIASITKPITVAAAMNLVDDGRLGLDDPVGKYLPEFRAQPDSPITVRHLMSHVSGLPEDPPGRKGVFTPDWRGQRIADTIPSIAAAPRLFKPGEKVHYSNAAFFVLGRVMEVASGRPYEQHVREAILDPLGMHDSYYLIPESEGRRVAVLYDETRGQRRVMFRFDPSEKVLNTMPDGGLFTYPRELAKFLQMFLDNDDQVLARESIREMLREQAPGVGLGWFLGDEGIINHGGSSGTNAWADLKTGVVGIVFFQLHGAARDKTSSLHRRFREEVRKAYPSDR